VRAQTQHSTDAPIIRGKSRVSSSHRHHSHAALHLREHAADDGGVQRVPMTITVSAALDVITRIAFETASRFICNSL
jgi:hypothetical protein